MTIASGGPWTVEDLNELPDDGNRYEIFDGSLLVSPPPAIRHHDVTDRLTTLLKRHTPKHLRTWSTGVGFSVRGGTSYYVPDIVVLRAEAALGTTRLLSANDVRLAVEVLSPGNRGRDLVLKRNEYAAAGIPNFWIVDADRKTVAALQLADTAYREEVTVKAGEPWTTTRPFDLTLDPADFC